MMIIKMSMHDPETGRYSEISQDLEYLGDVAELFLSFLQGIGYTYVEQVSVVKQGGEEISAVR